MAVIRKSLTPVARSGFTSSWWENVTELMNTASIDELICEHCSGSEQDSELHDLLLFAAERNGVNPDAEDITNASLFVCDYIKQVPYIIKVAATASATVGLESQMGEILQTIVAYWEAGNDIIPDHMGIVGLLDDAYCSLKTLQSVSDHYQLQTGKYLFPEDLSEANQAIHSIIGEPYASELDRIVIENLNQAKIIDAMKSLAHPEKQLHFATQKTIWNHEPGSTMSSASLSKIGLSGTPNED